MLPNKIYAGFDENTHLESYCTEKKGKCQTEYIRKDALLEWTKEQLAYYQKLEEGDPVRCGQRNAFQQVIDKINSL